MNKVFTMSNGTKYALFDEYYENGRRFVICFRIEGDKPTNELVIGEAKFAKDGTLYLVDIKDRETYKNVSSAFELKLTKKD